MEAMEVALNRLLLTDWSAASACRTRFFCFGCDSPLCSHCCNVNQHRAVHHPNELVDPLLMETISGQLAIQAERARGCGYSLNGIHRVLSGGRKYIRIGAVQGVDLRLMGLCEHCEGLIAEGSRYCSIHCKTMEVLIGGRRATAQHLCALAQEGQFGPPVLLKNRYCMLCRLAYNSTVCPDHNPHPHLPHHPLAGPESIKTVRHFDGWAAIPHGQLPEQFVHNVQVLHLPDGTAAYPIHRRGEAQHALPPIQVGAHACHRAVCHESFIGLEHFCSLRCRHMQDA